MKKALLLLFLLAIALISCEEEPLAVDVIELPLEVTPKYALAFEAYESFDETQIETVEFKHQVSLLSVGDIMAHTTQLRAAETDEGFDFDPQFKEIKPIIESADFAIGNLETVFAGQEKRYSGKNMIFNTPDEMAMSIKKAGFDILTTANNHSLDRGFFGISRTIEVLDDLGIMHTGTFATPERPLLIFEKDGISFALLSYSYSTNGWPMPEEAPYSLNMMEKDLIIEDIRRAKAEAVDFIIVANHWGLEYHLDENHHQRDLAEILFYEGADIILGTHPHVLQPFEHKKMVDVSGQEKDKFIIYSQGNFVSGQRTYPRAIGMYLTMDFERVNSDQPYVKQICFMPTYVEEHYKDQKIHVTIHDMHQRVKALEGSEKALMEQYESDFVAHVAKKLDYDIIMSEKETYVLYDIRNNESR